MNGDIENFITIIRFKNGKIKITHDRSNESNIYKKLYEDGIRLGKLSGKRIYYHRKKGNVEVTNIYNIRNEFCNFLENEQYQNCPNDVLRDDIINWFLRDNPIRQNGLLDSYLKEELSSLEEHQLHKSIDIDPRKEII